MVCFPRAEHRLSTTLSTDQFESFCGTFPQNSMISTRSSQATRRINNELAENVVGVSRTLILREVWRLISLRSLVLHGCRRLDLSATDDSPQLLALHRISRCAVGKERRDRRLRRGPAVDDRGGGPGGSVTRCVVFHTGAMRSDVMDENGTPLVAIYLVDPATRADEANDFFEAAGLGRPVRPDEPNGQLQLMAYRIDGVDSIFGAAYAVSPSQVVESLHFGGMAQEDAISIATRIVGIEAVFVARDFRGREFGKDLLDAVEEHARAAGVEYLVARVESDAPGLREFYRSLGFTVKPIGDPLTVEGTALPFTDDYVDAVKILVESPTVSVR